MIFWQVLTNVFFCLQKQYYIAKIKELENKIAEIERELKDKSFKKLQKEHTEISKKIFESILYEKYEKYELYSIKRKL